MRAVDGEVLVREQTGGAPLADDGIEERGRDIARFVATWLPSYIRDNRNYLTVAIGCTGGQHRSVYLAEWLGRMFRDRARVLVRHRQLPPLDLSGGA